MAVISTGKSLQVSHSPAHSVPPFKKLAAHSQVCLIYRARRDDELSITASEGRVMPLEADDSAELSHLNVKRAAACMGLSVLICLAQVLTVR